MIWRNLSILLLLAAFATVTWYGAQFSYETRGAYIVETGWVLVPAYLVIGAGIAFAIALPARKGH